MKNSDKITKIASQIKKYISVAPEIAVLLGSGWGEVVATLMDNPIVIPYSSIKGMPKCHVKGHVGAFVFGKINGKNVCICQGRFHYYEGYDISDVVILVNIANALGATKLILTNAAGAVNNSYKPGDIMIIKDHINLLGANPLVGIIESDDSVKFTDMTNAYDDEYIGKLKSACSKVGAKSHLGVYLQTSGPNYETPAEICMFRTLGADAVGMSTVCEVLMAKYLGMRVVGMSLITNMGAGILSKPLSHDEVVLSARSAKPMLKEIIYNLIINM